MTEKLKKALEQLPEYEQDRIGQYLLDLLEKDEAAWDAALAASPEKLFRLRDEARDAYFKGETKPLDPEKL
jgi:hypothetical protein